jgi:hypothetical protein
MRIRIILNSYSNWNNKKFQFKLEKFIIKSEIRLMNNYNRVKLEK